MSVFGVAESLVDRLAHGQDRHGQRWNLHLPSEGETTSQSRTLLFLLGIPTFRLSLAVSVLTTFGPVILIRLLHSPASVGALIGAEGAFALVVPITAGSLSDRLSPSPLGRRLPFVLAGAPLACTGLALLPFRRAGAGGGRAV